MSILIAQRGSYLLFASAPDETAPTAIYDKRRKVWIAMAKPPSVAAVLARGYWNDPQVDDAQAERLRAEADERLTVDTVAT